MGEVGDVRDDLAFMEEVLPAVVELISDPANYGKFEFIRLLYGADPDDFYPGLEILGGVHAMSVINVLYFVTEGSGEVEKRAGGPVMRNTGHVYTLYDDPAIEDEIAYLTELGVDASDLLRRMNTRANFAPGPSREYIVDAAVTGKLKKPLILLHTIRDCITPPAQVSAYIEAVEKSGDPGKLLPVFVDSAGHVNVTTEQWLMVIEALENWVETGTRPYAEDDSVFPEAAGFARGFVPRPARF